MTESKVVHAASSANKGESDGICILHFPYEQWV